MGRKYELTVLSIVLTWMAILILVPQKRDPIPVPKFQDVPQNAAVQTVQLGDDVQLMIDSVEPGKPVIIKFPAIDYDYQDPSRVGMIRPPIWIKRPNVTFKGEGRESSRIMGDRWGGSNTIVVNGDVPMRGDERVDNPILPGRYSYHLSPGARLWFANGGCQNHATGYLQWDCWEYLRQWTLELAVEFKQPVTDTRTGFGFSDGDVTPASPWVFNFEQHVGQYSWYCRCQDGSTLVVHIPCGNYLRGIQRITLMVDLPAGKAWAAIGNDWVPVQIGRYTSTGFVNGWVADSKSVWNECVPWRFYGDADCVLHGMHWQNGLRYDPTKPVNTPDDQRYLYEDPNNPPFQLYMDKAWDVNRWILSKSGYVREYGMLLQKEHFSPYASVANFRMEDIGVWAANAQGSAVCFGAGYEPIYQNCRLDGGAYGLSSLGTAVTYVCHILGGWVDGHDACIQSRGVILRVDGTRLGYGGRWMGHFEGSGGVLRDVMGNTPVGTCKAYYYIDGSDDDVIFSINGGGIDDEELRPGSFVSPVDLRQTRGGILSVSFRDSMFPNKNGRPIVAVSGNPNGRPCSITCDNVITDGAPFCNHLPNRWTVSPNTMNPRRR